jgi:hypothetical protein
MLTQLNISEEDKSQATANDNNQTKGGANPGNPFVDNRTEALEQKKMQEMMKHSPKEMLMESNEGLVNNNSMLDNSQSKENIPPFQLEEETNEDESSASDKKMNNNTGLPNNLKTGVENLSGISLDDVNVHYNSEKPADLQALAYAQGTDIHLAPGQEEHLPHELGHVVQQKEGDVKPNSELMSQSEEIPMNNDAQLEKEADLMGDQALKTSSNTDENTSKAPVNTLKKEIPLNPSKELAVQRVEDPYAECTEDENPDYDPNAAIGTGEEDPVSDPNAAIGTEEENPVCDPNAEIGEPVLEDDSAAEESTSTSYFDSLLAAGMSASEMLSQGYQDGKEKFMEVAEKLDPSQLAQALPSMSDIMNYFIEQFWPDNTGWEVAIAGSAGGTIAGTDAGFPLDVDLGVEGNLKLSLTRSGSQVTLSADVTNAQSIAGAASIKAAKLPIGVKLESCDAFKLVMDLGNMKIAEHGIALLKQSDLKGFLHEAFSSYISFGTNLQVEYKKSISETTTVGLELGSNALASAFAEVGVKQGLEATFANPSETMDGKAELKGELGRHGKIGYSLLGGDENSTELDNAIKKLTSINIGALKEGGLSASQAFGLRVTANFPAFKKNEDTNYEIAIYSNNEIAASVLGQDGKLGANAEIVLALPEIENFINSMNSSEGVGTEDVAGLLPFSKINSELKGEATLRSISSMLGNIFDDEDNEEFDKRSGSINVKLKITKENLLSIVNNNIEKGNEIISYIMKGEIKLAILTAIDLFSENADSILGFLEEIEIETKDSNVSDGGIITPGQGDISGIALQGSVTTSKVKKYKIKREDLNLDTFKKILMTLIK